MHRCTGAAQKCHRKMDMNISYSVAVTRWQSFGKGKDRDPKLPKILDPKLPGSFEEWVNLCPERLKITPEGDEFLVSFGN